MITQPTLSISAAATTKTEGSAGVTPFTFTVKRTTSTLASTVNWSVVHGSTSASDFSGLTSGTLSFASGETSKTITVNVVGDTLAELNEAFSVLLSDPANAVIGVGSAMSVITNDDKPRFSIVANASSLPEGTLAGGSTPFTFIVTRDVGLGVSTVKWAVAHRDTNAQDFTGALSGTLSFAEGETAKTITVNVAAEAVVEGAENFVVQLSAPTNAVLAVASATATIANDDAHTLSIAATTPSKTEGSTGTTPFTFTVTRSAGIGVTTVNWDVAHLTTSAADFSGATSGTLSFASGETSKTITVNVVGDKVAEGAETFAVQLSAPSNATVTTGSASATIVNDDLPSLSIAADAASRAEGTGLAGSGTPFTFTVTRDVGVATASSVKWAVVHRGTNAQDFIGATAGSLAFAAGETTKTLTVNVAAEAVIEPDEAFVVQLSSPTGAILGTSSATATIVNDDPGPVPVLSIAPATTSLSEGNTGTTAFTFTVTRSSGLGASSATWTLVPGTATAADFSGATTGTVSFAAGETSMAVTVNVLGDTAIEAAETFSVQLSNPTGATIGTASAAATILNDDLPLITIASADNSRPEGNSGSTVFSYTVSRSSGIGVSSVDYSLVAPGDGPVWASVDDFTGTLAGNITFNEGDTSKVVSIRIAGDTTIEADEHFQFFISNPVNGVLPQELGGSVNTMGGYQQPDGTFVWTRVGTDREILNDDLPALSIATTPNNQEEGTSGLTGSTNFAFTVTRNSSVGTSSANWAIEHGTTDAADFLGSTSGTVNFSDGQISKTITISVVGDALVEATESFSVKLSNPVGATLATASASAFIINDDLPALNIAAATASQNEGHSGSTAFSFTVTRNSDIGSSSAAWAIEHGTTDAADFTGATSGTVSFAAGETSKTITVSVTGDTLVEGNETFSVKLSSPSGATLGTASATATITNDDLPIPTLSIAAASASKAEGNSGTTAFTFTVTRSSGTGVSSVGYQVNPFTASADDFASGTLSGTVSFAAGETSKTITVNVLGDTAVEGDELFIVQLSGPVNATIDTPSATGTILNDDTAAPPTLNIAVNPVSQAEGHAGNTPFTFTVTRSAGTGVSTVNWLLASGGTNSSDFAAGTPIGVNSTLTFAAGETSKTITVNVAGDTTQENDETFSVQLSSPTNGLLGTSTATATILDDDTPVISIAATDADKLEGTGTNPVMTFTISRSLGTGVSSVSYTVVAGTAVAGADYYGTTANTVTFANGETSKTITVNINGDSTIEPDETFQVVLSSPSGGRIGVGTATATIRNDDRPGIDGSTAQVSSIAVPTTVDDSIENLVETTKWGGAIGTGAQLTYSFSTANSVFTYASGNEVPYSSLNAAQKIAAVMAMNAITAICGVTFTEVPDTATSAGDIRWTQSLNGALSTAHAYYPSSWAGGGDVWIGPDASYTSPVVGDYSYQTFIHELGHSMGLNHPHQGSPAPEPNEDQLKYSVMSYRDNPNASTTTGYSSNYYPTDYMLNDVLALQYLYGVNTTTNQGDTVYQWGATSKVYDCIWDVGGNDTIDASNQVVACTVNLNGGTWSTIGTTYYNGAGQVNNSLSIAYEVTGVAGVSNVIENAIGSAQADTLIGNAVGNRLTGGAGADTLTGGGGADSFFYFSVTQGGDTITDFVSGTDKIEVYSANFANLAVGTLTADRFVSGTAPAALDGNAVFLYNSSNGQLTFDSNGMAAGGTTLIAMLSGGAALGAGDIRIVATTN